MGRQETPLDPNAGPIQRFAAALRSLRQSTGGTTYREMAGRTRFTASTLSRAAGGEQLPSLAVTLAYVQACGAAEEGWERRWREAADEVAAVEASGNDDRKSPYQGLTRFEPDDAGRFFGRERLVAELLDLVRAHRFTVVFGPSESGKSSLLRAGLIPALRRPGALTKPLATLRIFTPGAHPLGAARTRLTPKEGAGDTVVLVDQFEEAFTLCQGTREREEFLGLLLTARQPQSGLRVVIAVRSDFYTRCAQHPDLAAAVNEANLLVGPMDPVELRRVIVQPAQQAGLIVERVLTTRILQEVADQPGGLPLMSHALLETWRRRRGRTLTLASYQTAGGLHGAVARTAESAFVRLTSGQQELARRILLRLVTPGDRTSATRRPADRAELDTDEADTPEVLDRLARARLITLDDDTVDLAHEALITAWPRLRAWVDADRERLRVHRRLTYDARTWDDLGRDAGALYRGSRLATAEENFPPDHRQDLTPRERGFLTASLDARHHEHRAAARATRRLRTLAAALALLLLVATATAVEAVRQQRRAVAAQDMARSRELAAESARLLDSDPDLASLLAVEAYRTDPTAEARNSLYAAATLPLERRLTDPAGPIQSVDLSPGTGLLAAGTAEGTVRLWDVATGEIRRTLTPTSGYLHVPVQEVAFSPDAAALATYSGVEGGTVQVWDVASGKSRTIGGASWVSSVAFSPDGAILAIADVSGGVTLWDVATGEDRGSIASEPSGGALSIAFSPDGAILATGDGRGHVQLWEVLAGEIHRTLTGHTASLTSLDFSPDGGLLVTGSEDGTARLWDTVSGEAHHTFTLPGASEVYAVAFASQDTVAAGSADGMARLWDTAAGEPRRTLTGHGVAVTSLACGADGITLASSDAAGTIRVWDTAAGTPRQRLAGHSEDVTSLAVGRDADLLATASDDGRVRLWDADTGVVVASVDTGSVTAVALSPDGTTLATGDFDGTIRLWDVATGAKRLTFDGDQSWVGSLAFSADGFLLAAADHEDGTVRLWDATTGENVATLDTRWVTTMAFSPDGTTLAVGVVDDRTQLWDTTTGALRTTLTGTGWTNSLAFAPDSATLATASQDGSVALWDTATGQLMRTLTDPPRALVSVAFSPDGTTFATGAEDGTVQLWDATTLELRSTLTGHHTAVTAMVFDPEGATLATGDQAGTVLYWEENVHTPDEAIDRVCHAVNRDLTREERTRHLPDGPERAVC